MAVCVYRKTDRYEFLCSWCGCRHLLLFIKWRVSILNSGWFSQAHCKIHDLCALQILYSCSRLWTNKPFTLMPSGHYTTFPKPQIPLPHENTCKSCLSCLSAKKKGRKCGWSSYISSNHHSSVHTTRSSTENIKHAWKYRSIKPLFCPWNALIFACYVA